MLSSEGKMPEVSDKAEMQCKKSVLPHFHPLRSNTVEEANVSSGIPSPRHLKASFADAKVTYMSNQSNPLLQ